MAERRTGGESGLVVVGSTGFVGLRKVSGREVEQAGGPASPARAASRSSARDSEETFYLPEDSNESGCGESVESLTFGNCTTSHTVLSW